MSYDQFQIDVIDLAHGGTRLTTANVVAHLKLQPKKVSAWLDQMARDGLLDLEVDEDEGLVVYEVRGLTSKKTDKRPGEIRARLLEIERGLETGSAASGAVRGTGVRSRALAERPKSVPAGVLLGALFPGVGLAYAAPWKTVAIATLAVVFGWKILAWMSLMLGVPFLLVAMAGSALLGGLYVHRYNQTGRRTELDAQELRRLT